MKQLTILISWHHEQDHDRIEVFEANRRSFQSNNPGVDIITIMNEIEDLEKASLNNDIGIFGWYRKNGHAHQSRRYLLVEWDCWCNCDLEKYYEKVWDADIAAACVRYPGRDYWHGFRSIPLLPEELRPFATGIVPFSGILLSDNAMSRIVEEILKPEYAPLSCELRLPTIAAFLGMEPVVNPVPTRFISWLELDAVDPSVKGLHHPVKKMFPVHETRENESIQLESSLR